MQLKVNGATRVYDGDPEMPLLWYLRDVLNLSGTKYSCGLGQCGACTVHVDGKAAKSCITPMRTLAGRSVTTIEALGGSHAVQKAWMEAGVPQCGYCQSGQIMQAVALLKAKPKPSDADIDAAMEGVLCRCGTYQRIRSAIKTAAEVKA